jgi:hypothetical protein
MLLITILLDGTGILLMAINIHEGQWLSIFLAYFPYFEKIKVGLRDHNVLCVCPFNFWMPEPSFMKLGKYIMAPKFISTAYFINPSHQSVCLYMYTAIVVRQRLGKNVIAKTSTHATIELYDESFSVQSVSYQRKVSDYFYPELLVSN